MNFRLASTGRSARNDGEDRILPLINVVFLLLIFFMLVGHLNTADPFEIEPPASASAGEPDAPDVVIYISRDGRLGMAGTELDDAGFRAALGQNSGKNPPPAYRVKVDGGVAAPRLISVLEWLRQAGVEKVQLMATAEQQ